MESGRGEDFERGKTLFWVSDGIVTIHCLNLSRLHLLLNVPILPHTFPKISSPQFVHLCFPGYAKTKDTPETIEAERMIAGHFRDYWAWHDENQKDFDASAAMEPISELIAEFFKKHGENLGEHAGGGVGKAHNLVKKVATTLHIGQELIRYQE